MQASPSTTPSRLNHPRARNLLALVSALLLTLLFGVAHATAAVHAKSKAHKRAAVHSKSKKHSTKAHVKKSSKKASSKKKPTSSSTKSSTDTQSTTTQSTATLPAGGGSTTTGVGGSTTTGISAPSISSATTSTSSSGNVLFNGSLISSWWLNQSATTSRTQLVPDPDGAGDTVQQFTTYNSDVAPLTPTINPRSQLVAPDTIITPGNSYWESYEVYIPQNFTFPKNGWVSLGAMVYGYPYGGSPPAEISIENGAFRFQRNAYGPNPYQIAWTTPVVKGQWYRFTWHFDFSGTGWVQLYVNDVQQNLKSGSATVQQLPINLLDATDSKGPWIADEQLYYQLGEYSSVQAYFKNFKLATTQVAAES